MLRTHLYADPNGLFVHDVILESCRRFSTKVAIVDSSCGARITYGEYGNRVESVAKGLVAGGLQPGEVVAIYLPNSWEFCVTYHAATLASAVPTLLNPSFREREVRYQLENSGAALLVTDGPNINDINLAGLASLRQMYTTRTHTPGTVPFASLLAGNDTLLAKPRQAPDQTLAALPYSSGTTGLPKGVMLSHYNLVANVYQLLGPRTVEISPKDTFICFLPLYHIYGLNVVLNPALAMGAALVLMARFNVQQFLSLIVSEPITIMPSVPPVLNALCLAAEQGQFPPNHRIAWVKSGAAPLAPELARRFTSLTGIPIRQGYGMTEASPVTHIGFLEPDLYQPDSIGQPVAQTECRIVDENGDEVEVGEPGELVMRGPQFMLGYWNDAQSTDAVLRDGWYWSGDIVRRDERELYYVVDRAKEMIKYKGFPIAPAQVEAVLLEHPAVGECGVIGCRDSDAGEIPVAFVALRAGFVANKKMEEELCAFVAERLTSYKQPRAVRFVDAIPKTASGKILRRELRERVS